MGRLNFLYKMDLPHRAKLVYIYLRDRMDKEKKAWPGLNTIAKDLSLSRSGFGPFPSSFGVSGGEADH